MSKLRGRWIYDGNCFITSCCNTGYDKSKFELKDKLLYVPCICPKCGLVLFPPNTDDLKLVGMAGDEDDRVCN